MKLSKHSIGRCRSCKRGHRDPEGRSSTTCECGSQVRLERVWGFKDETIKCGAKCRNAVGPSCDCSCGGENHGINH